ncbi:MAG TPA: poly(R)-hydroxyalkanoic acid synthase subunit PhaE [Steroidobacteraceae bacterium]|nr:poly(R)-hydroxyalkanoic acid synthase subunit PhaE [Steroidobacteraceae bacterium]
MTGDPFKAWMGAWTEAQQTLVKISAAGLQSSTAPWQASAPLQAALAEHYSRMILAAMPPELTAPGTLPAQAAAVSHCQRAAQALAARASAIGADAARRLVAELSRTDAAAAPITTLAALHELWIECGEAAWSAAVHQDDYAAAQAEWLASLVELQLERRRPQQGVQPAAEPRP